MYSFLKKRLIILLLFVIIALTMALLNVSDYFKPVIDFMVQINPIINTFALGGVILLWIQIKAEHERSRREKAVDLLLKWNDSLKKETTAARRVVEEFTPDQCRCLYKEEPFCVNKKQYKAIFKIMNDDGCKEAEEDEAEQHKLNPEEISKLRWLTISFLNMFESILVAWQYSVADRSIIEAQFSYLFDGSKGYAALNNFKMACGEGACYPAIEVFAVHVQEKKYEALIEKGNVV